MVIHDPRKTPGGSEFSWGPGLTPPELEDAPPSQGGRYKPVSPPVDNPYVAWADGATGSSGGEYGSA